MGIEVKAEFIGKATIRVWSYVYDNDDALVDPTNSIEVTIKDKNGTIAVDEQAMTKSDTGIYTYDYNTTTSTTKGWYNVEVVVIDGTEAGAKTSVGTCAFKIK